METRPYFVLGDVLANVASGVAAALLSWKLLPPSWSLLLSMPAGMVLGMLAAIPITSALSVFFGAFEIMLPGMLSGMLAGMITSMRAAGGPLGPGGAAIWGAGVGIATVLWVYSLSAHAAGRSLHGPSNRA